MDPKPPLREDLQRFIKDQRTLKAFEKIFELIPSQLNLNNDLLEAIQIAADNANAQAFLAIALIDAVNKLLELKVLEPLATCNCKQYEDLSPRYEQPTQDIINPSFQPIESNNLNLEVS